MGGTGPNPAFLEKKNSPQTDRHLPDNGCTAHARETERPTAMVESESVMLCIDETGFYMIQCAEISSG